MRVWTSPSAASASTPQSFTPGNLSSRAKAQFARDAARLLAGHNEHWRWISPTSCPRSRFSAAPPGFSAVPASRAATAVQMAGNGSPARSEAVAAQDPTIYPANWSGFESDAGNFTGVSMEWTVPSITSKSAESTPDVTIWPGIGGTGAGSNDTLIQAGTDLTTAWTEVLPAAEVPIQGFTVSVGDEMAADVEYDPTTDSAVFFLVDYTTGEVTSPITQPVDGTSGDSAEWIVERHESCSTGGTTCIYSPLADFTGETISNGTAEQTINGTTTGSYIKELTSYEPVDMTDCVGSDTGTDTPILAAPGAVDTQGDFADTWEATGPADPVNCQWTIKPASAAYNATLKSGTTAVLTDTAANVSITCTAAQASGTTGASPQPQLAAPPVLATITSSSFGGCGDQDGNGWSVAQTAGSTWDLNGDVGSNQGVTTGDISGVAAQASGTVSGESCAFELAGTVPEGDVTYSNSDASSNPDTLDVTAAALTITQVTGSGCATLGINDNDAVTLRATYDVTSQSGLVTFDP
jgi:hypothetical protein